MIRHIIIILVIVLSSSQFNGDHFLLSQNELPIQPDWNIPEAILCPSEEWCRDYLEVTPDLMLYFLSTFRQQLAVIPPDGSEALVYDIGSQLGEAGVLNSLVALTDRILLYRYGRFGIEILQLDRTTGDITPLINDEISPFVSCAASGHVSQKPFYNLDSQRVVLCSENPDHNFNVHIVDVSNGQMEQTLVLGSDDLGVGRTRPWVDLQVGLDGNIYFLPFDYSDLVWGIVDLPEGNQNYYIKYDVTTQEFSLSSRILPEQPENIGKTIVRIDANENKYVFYNGGANSNRISLFYKIDLAGNILWQMSNPPLPDNIISVYLLDEDIIAVWGDGEMIILTPFPLLQED